MSVSFSLHYSDERDFLDLYIASYDEAMNYWVGIAEEENMKYLPEMVRGYWIYDAEVALDLKKELILLREIVQDKKIPQKTINNMSERIPRIIQLIDSALEAWEHVDCIVLG